MMTTEDYAYCTVFPATLRVHENHMHAWEDWTTTPSVHVLLVKVKRIYNNVYLGVNVGCK